MKTETIKNLRYTILLILFPFAVLGNNSPIDSLKNKLTESTGNTRAKILIELSKKIGKRDPIKSYDYAQEARTILEDDKNSEEYIKAEIFAARSLIYQNKHEEGIRRSKNVKNDCQRLKLARQESSVYNNIAYSYYKRNITDSALVYYDKTANLLTTKDDQDLLSKIMATQGKLYFHIGQYDKAIEKAYKSLEIIESSDDQSLKFFVCSNIALYHITNDYHDEAITWYNKTLEALKEQGTYTYDRYAPIAINNIGEVYTKKGEYKKALDYFEQCIEVGKSQKNHHYTTNLV